MNLLAEASVRIIEILLHWLLKRPLFLFHMDGRSVRLHLVLDLTGVGMLVLYGHDIDVLRSVTELYGVPIETSQNYLAEWVR